MRLAWLVVAAVAVLVGVAAPAPAPPMPAAAPSEVRHVPLGEPALAPLRYVAFCLRYPAECRAGSRFRGGPVALTPERWADLVEVNRAVNRGIVPERNEGGLATEEWLIDPKRGDCNDYAVSKRHRLIERGWPPRALLLSEVVVRSGEHHLVVLVRTRAGDLVLDNLNWNVLPWAKTPYRWLRMQRPGTAHYWAAVAAAGPGVLR